MRAILATTTATLALAVSAPALAQDTQTADEVQQQTDEDLIVVTGALSEFGAVKSDTPLSKSPGRSRSRRRKISS